MGIYTATFSAIAVTAAQDAFEIVAPSDRRVLIHDIILAQYTDFGDAAAEILSVLVTRGFTTAGSGGGSITPVALKSWNGKPAGSTVLRNNTTVAQDGTGVNVVAGSFNIAAGWSLRDALSGLSEGHETRNRKLIGLKPSERLVCRITAPADSLTMNGTLVFEEGVDL